MLFNLIVPGLNIDEGFVPCHIISQENTVGSSIKDSSDWFVGLLACCVPDLHFDNFVFHFDTERAELNTNGDLVFCLKLIVHDSLHKTRLANPSVANDDEFEHVIVLVLQGFVGNMFTRLLF